MDLLIELNTLKNIINFYLNKNKTNMAKASSSGSIKVSFGRRKTGKACKSSGPKEKNVKKYNRQGR